MRWALTRTAAATTDAGLASRAPAQKKQDRIRHSRVRASQDLQARALGGQPSAVHARLASSRRPRVLGNVNYALPVPWHPRMDPSRVKSVPPANSPASWALPSVRPAPWAHIRLSPVLRTAPSVARGSTRLRRNPHRAATSAKTVRAGNSATELFLPWEIQLSETAQAYQSATLAFLVNTRCRVRAGASSALSASTLRPKMVPVRAPPTVFIVAQANIPLQWEELLKKCAQSAMRARLACGQDRQAAKSAVPEPMHHRDLRSARPRTCVSSAQLARIPQTREC